MHVQRALQRPEPPAKIVGTGPRSRPASSAARRFGKLAGERGVELILFNPKTRAHPSPKNWPRTASTTSS
jgi:hypothetical protein